jgi:hypothetical protein
MALLSPSSILQCHHFLFPPFFCGITSFHHPSVASTLPFPLFYGLRFLLIDPLIPSFIQISFIRSSPLCSGTILWLSTN